MLFTPSGITEIEGEGPHLRRAVTHFEQKDTSGHALSGLINKAQYSSFEPLGKNACLL
jgi:hypothetical protein